MRYGINCVSVVYCVLRFWIPNTARPASVLRLRYDARPDVSFVSAGLQFFYRKSSTSGVVSGRESRLGSFGWKTPFNVHVGKTGISTGRSTIAVFVIFDFVVNSFGHIREDRLLSSHTYVSTF